MGRIEPVFERPSGAQATALLRLGSSRNGVGVSVTTARSQARSAPCHQPVSSGFATDARRATVATSATTGAGAALVACSSRASAPADRSASPSSARQAAASRRLSRCRPTGRVPTACRRGPNAPPSAAAGRSARVLVRHDPHRGAAGRYSVTSARARGGSTTWTRSAAGSHGPASPERPAPQPRQAGGATSASRSPRSSPSSRRWCPGCPGCPPCRRDLPSARGAGGGARRCARVFGGSLDGGRDDVPESCRGRASSATIRSSCALTSASSASMHARTPGDTSASNSSGGRGSSLLPPVYTTPPPTTTWLGGGAERLPENEILSQAPPAPLEHERSSSVVPRRGMGTSG